MALTPGQNLIWLGQGLSPDVPIYNMGWRFRLGEGIDPERFARAFASLVEQSDVMRMVVHDTDDGPRLSVLASAAGEHTMLRLPAGRAEAVVTELVQEPFDLAVETFRSRLIECDGEWQWILVQHHILSDAKSGELLFRYVSERYEAAEGSGGPIGQALPSFLDWVNGAGSHIDPEVSAFWSEQVSDLPTSPPPVYAGHRHTDSSTTSKLVVPLGKHRTRRLLQLHEDERFAALTPAQTNSNALATVLLAWLSRVTDSEQTTIGFTAHCRSNMKARRTPGLFMEVLPLSAEVSFSTPMQGLFREVVTRTNDLLMWAASGAGTAATHAAFNLVLNYLPTRFGEFANRDVEVEWLDHGHFDPMHALWVDVIGFEGGGDISLRLRFNEGLFPDLQKSAAASQILRVLDVLLDDPQTQIGKLGLARDEDKSVALTRAQWEPTDPGAPDVLDALMAHCRSDPNRVVLTDDTRSVTRGELWNEAGAVAHYLESHGVGAGDRVGVFLTRGRHLVSTLLGILRIGAAYVPLDPLQPSERIGEIVRAAKLSVTITERRLAEAFPTSYPTIMVEDVDTSLAHDRDTPIVVGSDAYVIFTSGTTGRPKGVRVGRPALARYAHWAADTFGGAEPATWALHSAIGFDLTVTSIFAPLISGGQIRAYRERPGEADLSILRVFEDDAVNVVKLTPSHLSLVVRHAKPLGNIRTLVLGGEDLSTTLSRRALEAFGSQVSILNEYGPTEATVGCMVHKFDPATDVEDSVPIGLPAKDTAIYVLDRAGSPVPDQVIGELAVSGPDRLASGYFNDPETTESKFVDNPFMPGTKMYLTGDRAHVRHDGVICYHGRSDDQVKINGIRIELGEISSALQAHPSISDAVVLQAQAEDTKPRACTLCGLGSDHPEADIDPAGTCRLCRDFGTYEDRAHGYFRTMDDLAIQLDHAAQRRTGPYDCLMLLSGGKDSSYALGRLVEFTPRVLAVTLDNGFISEGAKENIVNVCTALGVEHRFIRTRHMNEIFADSLERYSNVCNGCFKVIYTLSMQLAKREGIPLIVTGLSRGQLFETRLAPELFGVSGASSDEIDLSVLDARRSYHQMPDAAARLLNGDFFDNGDVFEEVQFVDFYRYCDVSVDAVFHYLDNKLPWLRPKDTGRSTNCLINDVGIYVHKKRRGYHNYALPYSWDVRMGHKTREACLNELNDDLDLDRIGEIMHQIGYSLDEPEHHSRSSLSAYYVADSDLPSGSLRAHLAARLPRSAMPQELIRVDEIPLTPNGKVDQTALRKLKPVSASTDRAKKGAARTGPESLLLDIWREVLKRNDIGVYDTFFDAGGDSLHAISVASRANRVGLSITAFSVLRDQTIPEILAKAGATEGAPAQRRGRRAQVDPKTMAQLGKIFGKRNNVGSSG